MRALLVYESMWGNSRRIAEAIAEGLGVEGVEVVAVHAAPASVDSYDLLVVGGPTHMHGMTTSMSRSMSAKAAEEDHSTLEPGVTEGPGLREWLRALPQMDGAAAASFDTRIDRSAALTGSAARGIARRLRHRGYDVIASESFFVEDSEGPLAEGELERARAWGGDLASAAARA